MKNIRKRLLSGLICLVMILLLLPVLEEPVNAETGYDRGYTGSMPGDGKIYAHGVDVSAWQESGLNFQNFANAGYDYVILRCGTSYGKDKCFEEYYASAKAAGLDVGCYFYSYAMSAAEAQAEAYDVLDWIAGKVFEYPVYFDFEDPTQMELNGTRSAQICRGFMDVLKANGYLAGIYSYSWLLSDDWITTSGIRGTYEAWVAHVYSDAANTGITSNEYNIYKDRYCSTYGMHQYSFTTYVNGAGPYDANVCYKDYPSIVKTFGFNGYGSESWVEEACFDAMVYRDRYDDLAGMTDKQLKEHWLKSGIKEGRCASTIFDLAYYRANNKDLQAAFGEDYTLYYKHFITSGYKEDRKFSRLFDGYYYNKNYPDVANSFKENFLLHYITNGMKEGRRASLTYDPDYYWFIRPDVYEAWPDDYTMAARHYAGHGIKGNITAYDTQNPVISDVKISDVTAAGYTVSCTVTDNWGVNKVVFPTWTVLNNQDDLAEDFMNTQKGTKNGDTFTFRVNASDHNNEGGHYVTHIYAIDKGGNQVQLVLDTVEVKNPEVVVKPDNPVVPSEPTLNQITLVSYAAYAIEGKILENVTPSTTVTSLLAKFKNDNLQVRDVNGKAISGSTIVGTGATINLYSNGQLVESVTVCILGDMDGNGRIDSTDYMRVKSAFLGTFTLNDVEESAADVDGNGRIDSTDYMRIKAHFLGTYNLHE